MLEDMYTLLNKFLSFITSLLPLSPFSSFIDEFEQLPFLGYLNWFVPVGSMLKIGSAWITAIGIYYLYSVIARWIKLIA